MDLLAGYSDDADSGKNTPTFEKNDQVPPVIDPAQPAIALEAEWESFEKMIGGAGFADSSGPPPLPVAAPQMPVLSENMNPSEPPKLTSFENQPNSSNHIDPPILANMSEPPKLTDIASTPQVTSEDNKNPPKLTDVTLSSEFNSDAVFEEQEDEMPTLTKMTGSVSPSPEHSSSRSSSSGSRSSSVDSVKIVEKKRSSSPASKRKSSSPSRTSSSSHRKDERRRKRSRSRSRSRSPHRRRRSSDRKRSRSQEKKRRPRSRRSRSRGKKHHRSSSHSKRRSHSRSRRRSSRERRSSRDRGHKRKEDSRRKAERRDRSRDRHRRSRSRSGSPIRGRERFSRPSGGKGDKKPLTFKEKMRQQLLKASKILSEQGEGVDFKDLDLPKEKPSNLPLNATNIFNAASTSANVTPQMALLQTMAAMHQKAQEMTGVAVPKYYNPAAVNPLKYAEQVQKRKLLWSKNKDKKEEDSQWKSTAFVADQDGKVASKFRKLMGMKEDEEEGQHHDEETEEQKKKTEEMFYRLDKEYEFARMTTHTHRGIGLGFQSQGFPNP